jgi:hypothetical protein
MLPPPGPRGGQHELGEMEANTLAIPVLILSLSNMVKSAEIRACTALSYNVFLSLGPQASGLC